MKRAAFVFLGVLLLTPIVHGQPPEQKAATLAYVEKLQNKDGGFSTEPGRKYASSLRVTFAASRIYKCFGLGTSNRAACVKFVETCFDKSSGGFADWPGDNPSVAATALGLMLVVDLKMPREPFDAAAVKYLSDHAKTPEEIRIAVAGLEAIEKKSPKRDVWIATVKEAAAKRLFDGYTGPGGLAHDYGIHIIQGIRPDLPDEEMFREVYGDGSARNTGSATVALLRLGVKVEDKDAVLTALNVGQLHRDGGFAVWANRGPAHSDLESSYRVMRCYHMLGGKPNIWQLKQFVASCRKEDGGYSVEAGKDSSMSATYFAMMILDWLAEK